MNKQGKGMVLVQTRSCARTRRNTRNLRRRTGETSQSRQGSGRRAWLLQDQHD
jgi:hypothetical protein